MVSDLMVWVDIETEGLNIATDGILEIGIAVSDTDFKVIAAQTWLVAKPYDVRANLNNPLVLEMHEKSGLLDDLERPGAALSWMIVQKQAIDFLRFHGVAEGKEPMCGSTIQFDRKFLERSMPALNGHFHYRSIDVSSVKEIAKKFGYPVFPSNPDKAHRPLQDLMNSMAELAFYRRTMFQAL